MHESLPNDPGAIWRNQSPASPPIALEEARKSARRFEARSRRNRIFYWASLFLFPVMFNVRASIGDSFWWQVVRCAILAAWLFNMEVGYVQLRKKHRLISLSLSSGLTPCLDYYKKELLHHLDFLRDNGLRLVYPLVIIAFVALPAVFRAISEPRTIQNLLPYAVLAAVWSTWSLRSRNRELPRIQNELKVLNVFYKPGV